MNDEVILYSIGCPKCEVLKKKLNEKNIAYREETSVDEIMAQGLKHVPALKADGKILDFSAAVKWIRTQGEI